MRHMHEQECKQGDDKAMIATFEALAHPDRRRILELLRDRETSVGDMVRTLGLTQPGVSKHLRTLRATGLVYVRREGQRRWYRIRTEPLAELDFWLAQYRHLWSERPRAGEKASADRTEPQTV